MVVGIGGFRDIGDPNDPRRRMGARPQAANIIGLPQGGRYDALTLLRGDRARAVEEEMARQKLAETIANMKPEGSLSFVDKAVSAITGKQAANTPEAFYSAQIGRPVSRELANRALQYSQVLPELTPQQALSLALREAGPGVTQDVVDKMAAMSELRPDLAVQNAILAAETGTTDAVQAAAATMAAESPRQRAEAVVDMRRGEPFRETTRVENADISSEQGRNRQIPGTGRRNPFKKEQSDRKADAAYSVPILVGPEDSREGKDGPAVNWSSGEIFRKGRRVGDEVQPAPVYDPRKMRVAMVDPTMAVPADVAAALNLARMIQPDDERSGAGMNVPTPERNYFAGVGKDEQGSMTPGFRVGDDVSDTRVPGEITIGQAVKQIIFDNSTPIKTVRVGGDSPDVVDTSDYGLVYANTANSPRPLQVFPLKNQPAGYEEQGLLEVRVGAPTQVTNEGLAKINALIEMLPGMEGGRVLANRAMDDRVLNQAQRQLLQKYMSEDIVGDVGLNPTGKVAHDLIKALEAGADVPPSDRDLAKVPINFTGEVNDILASSSLNPKVQELRAKYRDVAGLNPKVFTDYADSFAGVERIPKESESVQMDAIRSLFRAAPSMSSQADADAVLYTKRSAEDDAVDLATRRQVAMNDSQLNAPTNPAADADEFAKKKLIEIMELRRNRG